MALRILTHAEQVAAYLRGEILKGRWSDELPGVDKLGTELDVNHTTMNTALRLLEEEGFLKFRGHGRRRMITVPDDARPPSLRIRILLYEKYDAKRDYMVELLHRLNGAGHTASFATKTLLGLKMNRNKVARFVRQHKTDAWVVFAGSRELLEWFSQQPEPAIALAGRRRSIDIAGTGPDKVPALRESVRRLIELGHQRIVMLTREERRKPNPGLMECTFLEELEAHGISTGPYNLPDWEDNPEGLYRCLNSLLKHTPPTAMIIDDVPLYLTTERHLTRLDIIPPQDISLICLDPSPDFAWYQPSVAHISWESRPMTRRIVKWAQNVAQGKDDKRKSSFKAEFIEGGTIGPAPTTTKRTES